MITHTSNKSKLMAAVNKSAKLSMVMHTWGYSIKTKDQASFWSGISQSLAGGAAFVSAGFAVGIWIFSNPAMNPELLPFKLAFTGLLLLVSVLALWFTTQGTAYELQVDRNKRQMREVLRNKKGREFVLRRLDFSEISAVIFKRDVSESARGYANLMIRLKSQVQSVQVVFDKEADLEALRDILAQDFLQAPDLAHQRNVVLPRRVLKRQKQVDLA